MKNLFLSIVAILLGGCSGLPPQYAARPIPELPENVCWWFGGKVHCPPADGSQLVLPCDSPNAVYERPIPMLPKAPVVSATHVVGTITATDAAGKPAAIAEVCGPYGCTGVRTPAPIVEYEPYRPPVAVYVQPPPKKCPKGIVWGPQVGYGPWGLPSGPPLRRHR